MNTGIIASRYAKALLRYVVETGAEDKVYHQACVLQKYMDSIKQLEDMVRKQPQIPVERKLSVLETALEEPLASQMERFIRLVDSKGRMEYLHVMLDSFIRQYRDFKGIKVGVLVTASLSEGLKEKVEEVLGRMTSSSVHVEMLQRPEIIGGFVLEIDDLRLDASIKGQLQRIRKELVENNNRIV
ncbi:MAG: ATP synthase F1 subunit delta [Bacteroidales bacterium]|nr:ATP synthase F1 subunit delta [Bacteroidales bacterium]MBQ6689366.1 ATP synthase F1 subunit delta [Bacteroidales bacterium]